HSVDRVFESEDLALHVDRDLARQIAPRHGGSDVGDVADLAGQVGGHGIHRIGQILPGAGDARHLGLAAELALGTDFARDAGHLGREAVELVDHRVHGFLQLQDLSAHVHRDLAGQVAAGDGRCHLCDVTDLCGKVARHRVDVVGEVLPHSADVLHVSLTSQLALRTGLTGHAGDLCREGVELVDHRVDGFLELQNLTSHVDGDLAGEVAVGNGGRHRSDVANLAGEVAGHRVHTVGEGFPGTGDSRHHCLPTELALGTHFARHTSHLGGERAQLIHHRVDGFLQLQNLSAHVHRDLA